MIDLSYLNSIELLFQHKIIKIKIVTVPDLGHGWVCDAQRRCKKNEINYTSTFSVLHLLGICC